MHDCADLEEPHSIFLSGPDFANVNYWMSLLLQALEAEKSRQEHLTRKGYGKTSDDDSQ
nr:MAG TPA: hypothetical protein [Caudoviricetes sp.]